MNVNVKIENDEIVIRVPLDALPYAVEYALDDHLGIDHGVKVTDLTTFAKGFLDALHEENDLGETILTVAFDRAIVNAYDDGVEGLSDDGELD